MRSVWCWWAGAFPRDCSGCLCWTRAGVRETPATTAGLLGLSVVGVAAGMSRSSFLFEYSCILIPINAKMAWGFILHQQKWLFALVLLCMWPSASAALLQSSSWNAESKLRKKSPCLQVPWVSLTAPHRPLQRTKDWLTNQLDYLKIHSHNICFISNKYLEA